MLPRWQGQTVAIVASGPSLASESLDALRDIPAIAISDNWRKVPFADILYSCDPPWWHHHKGVPEFQGERWSQHKGSRAWPAQATAMGVNVIRSEAKPGISLDPSVIHTGANSGFQALNLAILAGASRVLLLGYDMQQTEGKSHWFGDHPAGLQRTSPYHVFRKAFEDAAAQIESIGVDVINCSRETALTCFPRASLEDSL
jgi:hypothetical protein